MFTGLIQAIGKLTARRAKGDVEELEIESATIAPELGPGDSIAVSGVCLTATHVEASSFRVEVAQETRRRSRLGGVAIGGSLNLELPLRAADRLGGHFVQGHVDEVGRIVEAGERDGDYILRVAHDRQASILVVEKGSVALDGVSLTVSRRGEGWFEVMLIPHTLSVTTLSSLRPGDEVNLEYDILAKYMARMMEAYREQTVRPESDSLEG